MIVVNLDVMLAKRKMRGETNPVVPEAAARVTARASMVPVYRRIRDLSSVLPGGFLQLFFWGVPAAR